MNLLISEVLPADAVLDRAIWWVDDLPSYPPSSGTEDEPRDHPGRIVSNPAPAWYELRLSALRRVILNAD